LNYVHGKLIYVLTNEKLSLFFFLQHFFTKYARQSTDIESPNIMGQRDVPILSTLLLPLHTFTEYFHLVIREIGLEP